MKELTVNAHVFNGVRDFSFFRCCWEESEEKVAAQTEMQMSGHSGSTGHWQKDPRKEEGASATGSGLRGTDAVLG